MSASAKVYFTEDFDYTVESQLVATETWMQHASTSANPILVTSGNLTHAGYCDAASGQQIQLGTTSSSQKAFASFKNEERFLYSAGKSLYYSALINLQSAPTEKPAHFLCFAQSVSGDNVAFAEKSSPSDFALLSATQSSEGKYKLNISRNNTTAETATTELLYNTTYLVVVKYTFVEGTTNDIVSLYINPTSTHEPSSADASSSSSGSGSDITTQIEKNRGIQGITVRQGGTFSRNASAVTLDAIRVADTWADLFPAAGDSGDGGDSGEGGEAEATPMLECGVLAGGELSSNAQLDGAVVGEEITCTLHIAGKDLKGDITLTTTDADILSINPSSVSKADAEAGGKEVIVTIKPSSSMSTQYTITASSEEAEDFPISIYCMAQQPPYQSLQAFIDAFAGEESSYYDYTVKSDMVVTHVFQQNGDWCAYIQDATAGVRVYDDYGSMQPYKTGDRIEELIGTLEWSYGVYSINTTYAPSNPAVVSNSPAEPIAIGIADMPNYVGRLVRINNVAIATETTSTGVKTILTAGEATAELTTFSGSDVEIAALPAEADIIGIVRSANATVRRISPRSKADIIAKEGSTVNLENIEASKLWSEKGAICMQLNENANVEIFNVVGQQLIATHMEAGISTINLQSGIYLVNINGKAQKVIVK